MSGSSLDRFSIGFLKDELKIGEGQFTTNFSYFKLKPQHYGEEHKIGGTVWKLVLYPTGCKTCREPTLSVFLTAPECVHSGMRVKLWVTMVNNANPYKQEAKSTWFTMSKSKSEYGFDRFIPLSKLMNRREGWLGSNGELTLKVKIQLFSGEQSQTNQKKRSQGCPVNCDQLRYLESTFLRDLGIALTPKDVPAELTCPITMELMSDPVMLIESGQIYDRHAIEGWLKLYNTDPATNVTITDRTLKSVYQMRAICQQWRESLPSKERQCQQQSQQSSNQEKVLEQFADVKRLGSALQRLVVQQQSRIMKLQDSMQAGVEIEGEAAKEMEDQLFALNQSLMQDVVKLIGMSQNVNRKVETLQRQDKHGKIFSTTF